MNRNMFRTIFSRRLGMLVPVSEVAKTNGKDAGAGTASGANASSVAARKCIPKRLKIAVMLAFAGTPIFSVGVTLAESLPTGGVITAGTGAINQSGSTLTINQSTQHLSANWQSFNIGANHSVVFNQPNSSSVALNRIIGSEASSIFGNLSANGQVFLINPNGILFAPGSQVNVGGLAASTLNMSEADFAAGRYRFTNGSGAGSVVNQGQINAGSVVLIGPQVINSGTISTPGGRTTLAAGDQVTVSMLDGLLSAQVDVSVAEAEIQNHGQILANGGRVDLIAGRADSVLNSLINTDGVIRAQSVREENGRIFLDGGAGGTVKVSGILDASAPNTDQGGEVRVFGDQVTLSNGATVDVSGQRYGGTALIGGDFQGKNAEILNASNTSIESGSEIRADGSEQGGRVIVWSNGTTQFAGDIYARGRGFAEVSGKGTLSFSGNVDTGGGTLLLDPTNITVQSAAGDQDSTFGTGQLAALLTSNNVTLAADNNITWNSGAALDYNGTGNRTLTLQAGNNISYSGSISDSVAGGDMLSVIFNADRDASGVGGISLSGSTILTSGGDIIMRGGNAAFGALPLFTDGGYEAALRATAARGISISGSTLNAGGGNIVMRGVGVDGTSSAAGIFVSSAIQTSGTGAITLDGIGGAGTIYNRGVATLGANISTVNGALTIQGMGGGTGIENSGVRIDGGTLQATGSGNFVINGLGSTGTDYNDGFVTQGGALRVNNGDLTITGSGRGTGLGSDGVEVAVSALVEATGSGNVTLNGTSSATGANTNRGVTVWLSSTVRTANGALTLQGASSDPSKGNAISLESSGVIGGISQSGPMTLTADTMNLASGTVRGTGSLLIQSLTPGASVGLGNGAAGTLNLTSTELGRLADGFSGITIGRSDGSGVIDIRTASFLDPVTIRGPQPGGSISVSGTLSGTNNITLQAGNNLSLSNGTVTAGGALAITGASYSTSGASVLNSNTLTFGNSNTITNTGTLTLNQTAGTTVANVISGSGNLVKAGSNTLFLTGVNTYTGSTTIDAGTLQISPTGLLGSGSYAGNIINNGTFQFFGSTNQTLSGVISGSGSILKDIGSGLLTLAGSNTYTGTTTTNYGTIAVTNPLGLGDTTGGTIVNAYGGLDLQNVAVGNESVTLAGGVNTYGILRTSTGNSSLAGAVTLSGPSVSSLIVAGGSQLTLSGVISGPGALAKSGAGTLLLTAANTYTGSTTIDSGGGTLAITNDSALGSTAAGTNLRAGATLELRNVTIAESITPNGGTILASTGVNTITSNMGAFTALPINVLDGVQLTIAGTIHTSTPITKNGVGTLILTGNNTNTGATTINAGTLQVGNNGTTGKLGTGAVTNNANLVFNRSDSTSMATLAAGGITGTGNVTALIGGSFDVNRSIALTGANSSILLEAGKNNAAGDVTGGDVTLTSNISTSATGTVTIFSGNASTAAYESKVSGANGATRYKTYNADAADTSGAVTGTRNYYYRQNPGTLSVSGLSGTKVYDGLTDVTNLDISSAIVNNLIDGDVLAASSLTFTNAQFNSPNAGTRTINATASSAAPSYSGGGATWAISGYSSTNVTGSGTGTITPASLTVSANNDAKIVTQSDTPGYNGASFSGFVNGESAANLGGALMITRSNAGTNSAGNYTDVLVPSGYTSGNYTITYANGDFRILPAQQLLVKVQNVVNNYGTTAGYTVTGAQYLGADGSTIHTLTQTAKNGNTYTFSDNVGGSVTFTVTPQGAILSGAGKLAAGNYALAGSGTSITGNNFSGLHYVGNQTVNRIALTPQANGVTKVYDGTTSMSGMTLKTSGLLAGDVINIDGSGAFSTRNAGTNRNYNIFGLSLSGADADNYYLSSGSLSGNNGIITPRSMTVTAVPATKAYDGTRNAPGTPSVTGSIATGDSFALLAQQFATANPGTNITISPLVSIDDGNGGGNYVLTLIDNTNGVITPTVDMSTTDSSNAASTLNKDNAESADREIRVDCSDNSALVENCGTDGSAVYRIVSTGLKLPEGLAQPLEVDSGLQR